MLVFYEETSFIREPSTEVLTHRDRVDPEMLDVTRSDMGKKEHDPQSDRVEPSEVVDVTTRTIRTPWPGPRFWRYAPPHPHSMGIMLRGFVQPVMMIRNPILLWCALQFGMYQVYFNCKSTIDPVQLCLTLQSSRP